MCKQKRSHFHFQNGWPYIVYHTALFCYYNLITLHCTKTFIHCERLQHTFIAKLLSRVFRKKLMTSHRTRLTTTRYKTGSTALFKSTGVTENDLCTVNSSVSGFLRLDKQSVRWFTSEIPSSLHRAIVLTIWREREGGREREGEREGGREGEGEGGRGREGGKEGGCV